MSAQNHSELHAAGFDFLVGLHSDPNEDGLPDLGRLPYVVAGQYTQTNLFYVASDIGVATIENGGLPPGFCGFDESDEAFFIGQFDEQQQRAMSVGRYDPDQADRARSFVLSRTDEGEPKPTTLIPEQLLWSADTRVVPEPLSFFLRNMHHLSQLGEVEQSVRDRAEHIVQKHLSRLVVGDQIAATVYGVSAESPALVRALLGDPELSSISAEQGVERVRLRQTDQVQVEGTILTEHLRVYRTFSVPAEPTVSRMLEGDSMVLFRPADA